MSNENVDLRDEIQFLRELVDRLLSELKQARADVKTPVMLPPAPIIIEKPVIQEGHPPWAYSPFWQQPWYGDRWCTSPNTIGNDVTLCSTSTNLLAWSSS